MVALNVLSSRVKPVNHAQSERRLRVLVDDYYDFVWRTVRRMGLRDADVDDVVQEVFLVLSRKLDVVPEGRERGFLYRAAIHESMHALRALARRRESTDAGAFEGLSSDVDVESLAGRAQARELLDRVLGALPGDLRAVFILFELEQATMSEIAEVLSLAPGTVASRLRRARAEFEAVVARLRRSQEP
jgi:RNA polymerase sigma-70 factor (ECF subfamily)